MLLVDQWIETGGTMKAAIQLVEKLGATVVGQSPDVTLSLLIISKKKIKKTINKPDAFLCAGVAAVAIENTPGGKWIKDNYKFSHCVPEELQCQIDRKFLESFKSFKS